MFLDNLTSSMQTAAAASTSAALVSSTGSHYDTSTHAASSIHETRVITGGGGGTGGGSDSSISDIISLDWATSLSILSGLFSLAFLTHITHYILFDGQGEHCAIIWEIFSFDLALVYSSIPWLSPIFPGVLALVWSAILGKSAAPYTQPVQGGNILQLFHPGIL